MEGRVVAVIIAIVDAIDLRPHLGTGLTKIAVLAKLTVVVGLTWFIRVI